MPELLTELSKNARTLNRTLNFLQMPELLTEVVSCSNTNYFFHVVGMLFNFFCSPVLKESIELAARRAAGRLLQLLGPAAEKAWSPNRVFIRLTRRSHLSVDRSHRPEADECVSLQ